MKEDWIECTLGDIAKIYNGNSINKRVKEEKYTNVDSGLSYIGTKDVQVDGKISYDTGVTIPFKEEKFKIAPKNSVLVCSEGGSAGKKTAFVEKEICFGNKLYAITNEYNCFESKYIYHYTRFNKFFDLFRNQMNGIIGGVSQRKFNKIIIPLSPLVEQKAIVKKIEELFSSLDSGIADLKKAQDQLVIYRQAVLKKAFEGEWETTTVGELFDFIGGGTPSKREPNYWNGNIPWASVKDIKGDYLLKTQDFITEKGLNNSSANLAKKNDIILITRISPGKSLITTIDTAINQDLKVVKPKVEIHNKYVHYLFKSIERICIKLSSGTTVKGINLPNLKSIEIPLVEHKEQHQIVQEIESRLSVCDTVEKDIADSLEKAIALRQSILKKAFEGTLLSEEEIAKCKADKEYESASVLLERIKAEKKKKK